MEEYITFYIKNPSGGKPLAIQLSDILISLSWMYEDKKTPDSYRKELSFFSSCVKDFAISKSQFFQDIWVLHETDFKKKGFFVDFGATTGIKGNNSYLLEKKYEWDGIVVEPNPIFHDRLKENRNCKVVTKCVYSKSGETINFLSTDDPNLSTIEGYGTDDEHSETRNDHRVIKVETISLVDLLIENDAPKDIDYISVDTEGSEYDILESFFNDPRSKRFNVKCFTVEQNFKPLHEWINIKSRTDKLSDLSKKLNILMQKNGYKNTFPEYSGCDGFFIKGI